MADCVVWQCVGAWGPVGGAPTGQQTVRLPALVAVGQLSSEQPTVSSSFEAEQCSTSAQLVLNRRVPN